MPETGPRIVLDSHIPGAADIFSSFGQVTALPGHEIDRETVKQADMLIVRSITRVGESLLSESNVRFVGSATAGIDHLDTEYFSACGVDWAHAPGANAQSVVEYVWAAISVIASRRTQSWHDRTLGVIGCGNVGERLARRAESIGMNVLRTDPPRARREGADVYVDLEELLVESDIVSVHVPLTADGVDPTVNLLDGTRLAAMKPDAWLIQSSRGGTVDERAAVSARKAGRLGALVLDVFENEPLPDPVSVAAADLATGHIAGYSRDAKRKGVLMIRDAALRHFGIELPQSKDPIPLRGELIPPVNGLGRRMVRWEPGWLHAVVGQVMDIRGDDARFRDVVQCVDPAEAFHAYRAGYPPRYAWSQYRADGDESEREWLSALGFNVREG